MSRPTPQNLNKKRLKRKLEQKLARTLRINSIHWEIRKISKAAKVKELEDAQKRHSKEDIQSIRERLKQAPLIQSFKQVSEERIKNEGANPFVVVKK